MRSLVETIGYVGRALSAEQDFGEYTLGPYIMQSVLLLVAPALFAASIYMELGRIVLMVKGERSLFVPREWLTKLFVAGDVLSFLMQSCGAGVVAASGVDIADIGNNIVIAGLIVQVVVFGLFVIAALIFHSRLRKEPTAKCYTTPWEKHMHSLYLVSILIFIRSIVRVVEYVQGHDGCILVHEAFLCIFDAPVMWIAMLVMNWIHPSEVASCLRGGKTFTKAWKLEHVSPARGTGYNVA
ncbi:hypothetical protein D0865_02327 [Hortaea werneckii]|uniref:RTA1 domain protein n=1 Tax=Hortaea werneckii TaxID=91943 RepID=A0A3M7D454_HORWE|nr:hypothetical protein D0865_02327 [Hortaea werneckii]